ncbi:3-phosphoshikimate 1-carboxyvinyltransferase [Antricoccus suffuscus]|uniref:3-phosphoshikimate 1-carboxyvinyltransferase n=1 Tax=Antricoccus suffuscus TaxID=1629062 RepID=A0A2T1A418_9ACTN|nr:3-phosphoshikimate 1-carboxyvinyltransferase [Antricoccus suffuscus]PRZ43343.1 3-phosphoshikimate 1-carboxyvinyltransferase [Antricoccus suffuscus]
MTAEHATAANLWNAPYAATPVDGHVEIPGSKSIMARELILSALGATPSRLRGPLRSRDSLLMRDAICALGAHVDESGAGWLVTPGTANGDVTIDCGLSGTVMRFAPALAALSTGAFTFDGDEHARTRPMSILLDGLRKAGVDVADDGRGTLPFTVHGTGAVPGGVVDIDASASSQFVTGLLLSARRFERGITVRHFGTTLPSLPHILMTVEALRRRGAQVDTSTAEQWSVAPGTLDGIDLLIEPDLSNAAPFLAAALVTEGTVTIPHWPAMTTQPGDALRGVLAQFGADVTLTDESLTVKGNNLVGVDLDLSATGELAPVIAAICLFASGPSRLRGIGHIRGHETDRLRALADEFNSLGGDVRETPDGLEITPKPLHSGVFSTYSDHRMAHAGAVIGLGVDGIAVQNIETTAKTMPQFATLWTQLVTGNILDTPAVSEMAR